MATTEQASPRRRRTPERHRLIVGVIVAVAAIAACFDDASPTGLSVADLALRAGGVGGVTWIGSHGRRWSWLASAALATLLADETVAVLVASPAVALASWSAATRRRRLDGAIVAALASTATLHYGHADPHGLATVAALGAVTPLVVSGLRFAPDGFRRLAPIIASAAVLGAVVASLATLFVAASASDELDRGVDRARDGLDALRDGDQEAAEEHFAAAAAALDSAHDQLTRWWVQPARFVPVVGQHLRAAQSATRAGRRLAGDAATAARLVDLDRIAPSNGRVDIDLLASYAVPLDRLERSIESALHELDTIDTPWLLAPVRDRIAELDGELADALPSAQISADVAELGPELLGGDGPRTYYVIFTTPAEARGVGGFIGSWAELRLNDGVFTVPRVGRTDELNAILRSSDITLDAPADYLARYGRFSPERFVQDLTFSPDFPSVAQVAASAFSQAYDQRVDGIVLLDPYALGAILDLVGPVELRSNEFRLDSQNAAQYLLVDQYLLPDEETRIDALDQAASATVNALIGRPLPSIRSITDTLGPLVDERRISLHTSGPAQALFERAGLAGDFPAPDGHDLISLIHQNSANNKIDPYLRRSIDYAVRFDPSSGETLASATISLENTAPAEGLPLSVIGSNDQGLPLGTNRMFLSFYSPLRLVEARLDGSELLMETARELDHWVYSAFLTLPAGGRAELVLDLAGTLEPGQYRLRHRPQPLAVPDSVTVSVAPMHQEADADQVPSPDDDGHRESLPGRVDSELRVDV